MMIGTGLLFLITLMAPPVRAEVKCYIVPGKSSPICISDNNAYNQYMNQTYIVERPRYEVHIESKKAPPHNYSECTFATGCNPYK